MIKKNTYSFYHKRIRTALCAVLCSVLTAMRAFATGEDNSPTAAASTTVWTKASEIMQDVYSQIISISTVTAVVCAAVALLLMNFSKNGKTVDDSVLPGRHLESVTTPLLTKGGECLWAF